MNVKRYLSLILLFIFITQGFIFSKVLAKDTTVTASKQYKVGFLKKIFLGRHYRAEWAVPVQVSLFDADTVKGGLTPIKKGGSRQTTNLRLEDSLGRQFVIRSIDKTPTKALPDALQNTIFADIIQDQTSAAHPYSALVIPTLADAAKVYHANPQLYFIPKKNGLGEFEETFADMLVYLEERPDEDMSHLASVGNAPNVIGTPKLFEKLYKSPKNRIDERLLVRSRLFDMWIGDWGRHEDQWRWAEFKYEDSTVYQPIPRDRDHAFFRFDGVLPFLASRKWAMNQFAHFDNKMKDLYALNKSATSLDRTLFIKLTHNDWMQIAHELEEALTDSVIETAMAKMPSSAYAIHGKTIERKLKKRRAYISKSADRYYKELFKKVDIISSDKDEFIEVERLRNKSIEVTILKKDQLSDTIYHRVFPKKETREIRITGQGGDDVILLRGNSKGGAKVRIVGGDGNDIIYDSSKVSGIVRKNYIYDTKATTELHKSHETRDFRSDNPEDSINHYQRSVADYNFATYVPTVEYNADDGVFVGLAFIRKTFGFRLKPYASMQTIRLTYAFSTSSLSLSYSSDFKHVIRKWNLSMNANLYGPRFAWNYFGYGNESIETDSSSSFYRVRATRVIFQPLFYKKYGQHIRIGLGPDIEYVNIQHSPNRYIAIDTLVERQSAYKPTLYAGAKVNFEFSTLDNNLSPKNGIRWFAELGVYQRFVKNDLYANVNSDLSVFYTPNLPFRITFASRIGGAHNKGDFLFYRANTLGGPVNLRGYRRSRFYGNTSAFHNTELRLFVAKVNLYLFPAHIGMIGFYDYGRVWADNEKSTRWHTGYGPGLFLQIYDRAVLTGTYGFSDTSGYLNVRLGFLF
jgi:hypothetical protein